ncbi:GyrI-like domain-containing protein [Virgibacillus doumboii]|uniref:GyrI-like domain-containing protein n=1 Tax=Virgibacillus doumboii TaxID=2697503 RepID=UPI0013E095D2|nr:GyrI-like domain-containing protein [Virgibacillus doumboii]
MQVVTKGEMKLVGIRLVCSTLKEYQEKIPAVVETMHNRLDEIENKTNPDVFIGIHKVDATEEEDGYWKCVEVTEFNDVPNGMDAIVIPAQEYAAISHDGIKWEIHQAYGKMHQQIEDSEYERIYNAWTLETFDQRKQEEEIIRCTLYDPIRPS